MVMDWVCYVHYDEVNWCAHFKNTRRTGSINSSFGSYISILAEITFYNVQDIMIYRLSNTDAIITTKLFARFFMD